MKIMVEVLGWWLTLWVDRKGVGVIVSYLTLGSGCIKLKVKMPRTVKDNKCSAGYCSKAFTSDRVKECVAGLPNDWNGLCSCQNGNQVFDGQVRVEVACCSVGCSMESGHYARWNGLCAGYRRLECIKSK